MTRKDTLDEARKGAQAGAPFQTESPEDRESRPEAPAQGPPLLGRGEIESALKIALWAALMAAGAWIAIPIGPVPITLQTFFVVLAGFCLGPGKAFLAAALYVLSGILGFPVFAGGLAGPALIFGPTAGYALSFPLGALIAGMAHPKGKDGPVKPPSSYLLWGALGTLATLLCGSLGLMINMSMGLAKALAMNIPFLPGGVVKILAATLAARSRALRPKASKNPGALPSPSPEA